MARIRTVKPELWTDPEFTECSLSARLLLIAMFNFASDYGVLPDKPRQLKMQCLPADTIDAAPLVDELVDKDFLVRRVAPNGEKVLVIRTFSKNQKINRASKGRWGDPEEWGNPQEDSVRAHGGLSEPHPSDLGRDNSEEDDTDLHSPTCSTGDADKAAKKKTDQVIEHIVEHRCSQRVVANPESYKPKVRRDVTTSLGKRISELVERFPTAPVASIAHGAETGDTRTLAYHQEDA